MAFATYQIAKYLKKWSTMPVKYETTVRTKAPLSMAMDYYMQPENFTKVHPGFFKEVKVLSREGDVVRAVEVAGMSGRKMRFVNRMTANRSENQMVIETIEGAGKGSRITMAFKATPTGTEIHIMAEMEFGPLGTFVRWTAKSFDKVAAEDAGALDAMQRVARSTH